MTSNISAGTAFEREFCELLSDQGFWVHRISQNAAGQQPADVIAVYCGIAYLIDCKVCSNDRFQFSRMEENQRSAMDKWIGCKGTQPVFALRDSGNRVWILNYEWAIAKEQAGEKSVPCMKIDQFLIPLNEWLGWIV